MERATTTLPFSRFSPIDAENDRVGYRFDVPGRVLYGAYAEAIAPFRHFALAPELGAEGLEPGRVPPGAVLREWRASRRLRTLHLLDPGPFIGIDAMATHA